jgi:hypothetical protein
MKSSWRRWVEEGEGEGKWSTATKGRMSEMPTRICLSSRMVGAMHEDAGWREHKTAAEFTISNSTPIVFISYCLFTAELQNRQLQEQHTFKAPLNTTDNY